VKDTLLSALKYLLYLMLAVVAVLFILGLVYLMNWPWWVGIFLALALVGLVIGAWFLKRLLLRRKEQQFVQQVIEQDNEKLKTLSAAEQSQNKELQLRWKEAVETLRRSHLKKQGNPLYVLPWYLMMGESGSGKTTAINSARLSSPFAEVHHASGVSGTRNCDWWFFDQSIILDTAGRYAMPVDSGRDNDEWQKFLSLLVKYRRKEPIHGLIMTVAADKLLNGTTEALKKDGQQLRRRLDELMRVLGITFPVYLMVTKCDLVQGMTQFGDRLPEKSLDQPMGVVNEGPSQDLTGFLDRMMGCLAERLKDLRILMLHQQDSRAMGAEALLFPDEFQSLKRGIDCFVKAAFQENRYQETPLLRGIYFSSGRQEGTPYSHFLADLGLIGAQEVLPGTSRGLFLHDFFDKILPRDRRLFAPTTRALQWHTLTRNLGLTSWIVIWVACCGLLSYSFVKNMATIRTATGVIAKAPELKGDFMADVAVMDQYRGMIVSVEAQNRNWWVPRFWLKESINVEARLKERYCKQFQGRFLAPFDKNMSDTVSAFSVGTPDQLAGQYLVHLTRRINLLKLRLDKAQIAALAAKPLPSYVVNTQPRAEDQENSRKFGNQYLNYLAWRGDSGEINNEITVLQSLLKHIVLVKGASLRWLPDWVNGQGIAPSLTLQSFWGGSRSAREEPTVAPAFTRKGRELVAGFQDELRSAFPEPALLDRDKEGFDSWYRANCYAAWVNFAASFPRGEERLAGVREWQAVAEVMATDQGPYFAFVNKAASELEPFGPVEGMPPLLQQIIQYRVLKASGGAAGAATKAVEEGKKLTEKVGSMLGKPVEGVALAQSQVAAAKAAQDYQSALAGITPSAKSRTQAYQLALQVFSEDALASKSPFYQAADAAGRLKAQMSGGRVDPAFANLANGPLSFLWSFVQREAACAIQNQWEEKVLKEAQGASDPQTLQYLVAQDGPVWKFVNTSLGPFQGWSPAKGYYSKSALGGQVSFEPGFNSFLAKGAKAKITLAKAPAAPVAGKISNVTIKGLPTDANADARLKPQSTRLELQCASGPQAIENLNYPVSKTFTWSPESCGDVTLQIDVGDLVLTRQYSGPQGFPSFLKEFQGGRHTFYPGDFPREKAQLERQGIRFIRANYQFSGVVDVLAQAGGAGGSGGAAGMTGEIPRVITKCWQ